MKKFKIGLCFLDEEDNVVVKGILKSNWTVEPAEDLKHFPQPLIINEIANILTEAVKLGLNTEIIKKMLDELKEIENE